MMLGVAGCPRREGSDQRSGRVGGDFPHHKRRMLMQEVKGKYNTAKVFTDNLEEKE